MFFSVRLSTEHLLGIQTHIKISTWRETGYTVSTVLAMNFVVFAVYKLISWPVKSIWRRWWVEEGKNQRKLCLRYQNTPIDCRQLFRQTTSSTFLNKWALVSRLLTNFPHTLPSSVNFKRAIFHLFFALFTKLKNRFNHLPLRCCFFFISQFFQCWGGKGLSADYSGYVTIKFTWCPHKVFYYSHDPPPSPLTGSYLTTNFLYSPLKTVLPSQSSTSPPPTSGDT